MIHVERLRWPALGVGLLAAAGFIAAFFLQVDRAIIFRAYLFAYLFCLGLALGGMVLVMLHNLTGGPWGDRVRPMGHAAALTLPLMALLFIPICLGLQWLYPWARMDELARDATLQHRQAYLNPPFFFVRAALYFVVWIALAFLLNRPRPATRALSAAGLILYLFTMTHAGVDWVMSRDVEFYSTAFGFILTVGQTLSALALAIILLPGAAAPRAAAVPAARPLLLNDLGSLVMTLVILWAYVAFMQFLVVWMGNTNEDNTWYLERGLAGGGDSFAWRMVGLYLVVFHFFVPFYVTLFRRAKQNARALTTTAWLLLIGHVVDQYWLVAPSGHHGAAVFDPHPVDLVALVALTGIWFSVFLSLRGRSPAVQRIAPETPETGAITHD